MIGQHHCVPTLYAGIQLRHLQSKHKSLNSLCARWMLFHYDPVLPPSAEHAQQQTPVPKIGTRVIRQQQLGI